MVLHEEIYVFCIAHGFLHQPAEHLFSSRPLRFDSEACGREREGRTLVIVEEYGTGNPQKCYGKVVICAHIFWSILEPIKDRSRLASIFSVHELSHAKTSKSIHPTLPIRKNPAVAGFHPGRS